jgi:hypothetical protein
MKATCPATLCLLVSLAALPARAQTTPSTTDAHDGDAVSASLTELLALATMGTVTTQDQAAKVTRSGDDYRLRLPLRGFSTPADAAVEAVARPLDGGTWDITSMTFPSSGTVQSTMPNAGENHVAYSIGEQAIQAQVDPSFARPSLLKAKIGAFRLRSDQGENHTEQTIDHYEADGTLSGGPAGQLSFSTGTKATNWHLTAHTADGFNTDSLVRTLTGDVSVEGLDRVQGTRLMAAARALMAGSERVVAGQPRHLAPAQRRELHAMVDAASGLLTKFRARETLDDIRFTIDRPGSGGDAHAGGPDALASSGTVGRVRVDMTGDTAKDRVNARMDIGMDEFAMPSLSAETALYVPHHLDIKSVLTGVRSEKLLALLRAASAPDSDPVALKAQMTTLFGDPDAWVGIESLTFDSGPMRVTGSARLLPRADGQLGAEIHVAATGLDTLIAQAEGKPGLQKLLPLMFMAKGMGRMDGGAVVWDIAVGDGPVTVNGVPFGQPNARRR